MRLEDLVCIAINEVPSSPMLRVGNTFQYLDTPTSLAEHLDGLIQKHWICEDFHRRKRLWHRVEVNVRLPLCRSLKRLSLDLFDAHGHRPSEGAHQLIDVNPPHPNERLDFDERSG